MISNRFLNLFMFFFNSYDDIVILGRRALVLIANIVKRHRRLWR